MVNPTKLSEKVFRFEFENESDATELKGLAEFEYEGVFYRVKRVVECFDTPGYYSYLVTVK